MRLTPGLYQLQHWQTALQTLKASQLKHLADATGLRAAGPKADLIARIESELTVGHDHLFGMAMGPLGGVSGEKKGDVRTKGKRTGNGEMRILSIDMGIRNLAFAHLVYVPRSVPAASKPKKQSGLSRGTATLTAWRRIDLTAPSLESSDPSLFRAEGVCPKEMIQPIIPVEGSKQPPDFYLPLYAQHANTLLTTLLATYKPTHILIERQRFRSGGGSAVQEWSLRVGCFEAMLWAVLYAMARERLSVPSVSFDDVPKVRGVEPSRIVRYWGARSGAESFPDDDGSEGVSADDAVVQDSPKKTKGRTKPGKRNEPDAKKIRIDLAGSWLDKAQSGSGTGKETTDGLSTTFAFSEREAELQDNVQHFSNKWHGIRRKKGDKDIGKLDDLADCLVQGMTWLEWQVAKERIVNEGPKLLLEESES